MITTAVEKVNVTPLRPEVLCNNCHIPMGWFSSQLRRDTTGQGDRVVMFFHCSNCAAIVSREAPFKP